MLMKKSWLILMLLLCTTIAGATILLKNNPETSEAINQVIEERVLHTVYKDDDPLKNLEDVFNSVENNIELENKPETISIISTGDIMLGRTVNYKTLVYKDYTWAFKNIAELMKSADLTYINLENPLVENCPTKNEGMIFCAPNDHVNGLLFAGVDGASLANNHAYNYAAPGLNNTEKVLTQNNILVAGIKNPSYKDVKGLKIALLAYDDVECYANSIACLDENTLTSEIKTAQENADLVVIMFHWGNEYTHKPTQRQVDFAHLSIDTGADLVLGNHPHWYQPLEMYKEKLIVYSHGNTIFDQMWSEKTKEGLMIKSTFDTKTKKLVDVKVYPTYIKDYGQPVLLHNGDKEKIINNLKEISKNADK